MKIKAHPKILIATAFPPDVPGGSPWLFYQLLRGADPSRISWWSISGHAPEHTRERVGTYREGRMPSRLVPHRRFVAFKCFLLEKLWVPFAALSLRRYISRQKPDMLWIIGYGWSIPVLHRAVRDLAMPWHISVHDMADTDGQVASLGAERAAKFQRMMEDLYTGASSRDVYTQEIGMEMQRVTGKKHDLIIHCGAEPEEIEKISIGRPAKSNDRIRIGYPGTIISEDTFARFVSSLKLLPPELRGRVEVHLFGSHSYRQRPWYDPRFIVEHGFLAEDELDRRYRECDWGLSIMALDESNPKYNNFSFPCKFARALASCLPVLCLAHSETTLARFASNYPDIAPVISSDDPLEISQEIQKLLSTNQDHKVKESKILQCVINHFNAAENRIRIIGQFQKIQMIDSSNKLKL